METGSKVIYHVIQLADELTGVDIDEAKSVVGDRIRRGRKAAGLTAKELGEMLEPPVTHGGITSWERGRTTPSAEARDQLEAILGEHLKEIDKEGPRIATYYIEHESPRRREVEDKLLRAMRELSIDGVERLTEYAEFLAQKYPAITIVDEEENRRKK